MQLVKYDPFSTAFIEKNVIEAEEEEDYYEDEYSEEEELDDSSWRIRNTAIKLI